MRINARLDNDQSRKLEFLVQKTGTNITQVIRDAIEAYFKQLTTQAESAEPVLRQNGFIGCAEADEELSLRYKETFGKSLEIKSGHS